MLMTFSLQPDDRGTINDISVLRVTRRGAQADHFTQTPLSPGSQVQVRVDWERRFDHMQQHSGKGHGTRKEREEQQCHDDGSGVSVLELSWPFRRMDIPSLSFVSGSIR